jgi:hypothetical protein
VVTTVITQVWGQQVTLAHVYLIVRSRKIVLTFKVLKHMGLVCKSSAHILPAAISGDWSNKRKRKLTDCSDPGFSSASVRRHPKDFVFDARAVKRQHIVDPSFATVRPGALNGKSLPMPVSFVFPTCHIDPQTAYPAHAQTIRQCSIRKHGSCMVTFLQVQSLCYRVLKERQLGSPCRFGL